MEPLNDVPKEQPEDSLQPASFENAESVTSETSSSNKMKIEELTGEEYMEVDSTITSSSNVKSSSSSKFNHMLFAHFLILFNFQRYQSFKYRLFHK